MTKGIIKIFAGFVFILWAIYSLAGIEGLRIFGIILCIISGTMWITLGVINIVKER